MAILKEKFFWYEYFCCNIIYTSNRLEKWSKQWNGRYVKCVKPYATINLNLNVWTDIIHIIFLDVFTALDQCAVKILRENQKKVIDDETLVIPNKEMTEITSVESDIFKNVKKVWETN